jgi:hypothetical protein
MTEAVQHMRSYCIGYLQSTMHGHFGDRTWCRLALLKKENVNSAFQSFESGCALVADVLQDDHAMRISLLMATICGLASKQAFEIVLLDYRPAVGRRYGSCRREFDGKEQLIERGLSRRVRQYGVGNLSVEETTGGRLFGRRLATFNHRSM